MDIAEVRQKYPQYSDLTDDQLAHALHDKFYADMPYDQFTSKIGLTASVPKKSQGFFDLPAAITNPTPETIASDPLVRLAIGAAKPVIGLGQAITKAAQGSSNPLLSIPANIAAGINNTAGTPDLVKSLARTEQIKQTGMQNTGQGSFDLMGIVGQALSPVATKVTSALPAAGTLAGRLGQGGGIGALYGALQPYTNEDGSYDLQKLKDTIVGGLTGVAAQGVIGEPARYISNVFRQFFTEGGAKDVAKKFLEQAIGKDNLAKLTGMVETELPSIGKGPVPGYKPTVGEIVANAPEASPLLAIQAKTAMTPGGPSAMFGQRALDQQNAIRAAIGSFAGTPQTLNAAEQAAQAGARANYGPLMGMRVSPQSDAELMAQSVADRFASRGSALQDWGRFATTQAQQGNLASNWFPVPGMPRVAARYSPNIERATEAASAASEAMGIAGTRRAEQNFLEQMTERLRNQGVLTEESAAPLLNRPSVQNSIEYARRLAAERGYSFPQSLDESFTVQNLHDIKLGLDAQIHAGALKGQPTSLDNNTLDAVNNTKKQFLAWLESKVPGYGTARVEYSKAMVPVNQMQVGQALLDKLTSPVTGREVPGTFLRAINDETKLVKNILGQPRQDLGQVLNPRQQETVNEVARLLERKVQSLSPVQKSSVPGGQDIAEQIGVSLPRILSRPVVMANWLLGILKKGSSPLEHRIDAINTAWMLNPEQFVAAMRTLPSSQQGQVLGLLQKQGIDPMMQGLLAPSTQLMLNATGQQ